MVSEKNLSEINSFRTFIFWNSLLKTKKGEERIPVFSPLYYVYLYYIYKSIQIEVYNMFK